MIVGMSDLDNYRRQGNPSYTLSDALQAYRGTLGISQQQLADLTFELAEQGIVTQGLVQQHISRIEGGSTPQEPTLMVLATAIAHAYVAEGWDTTPAEILKHLRNAKSVRVMARDVSPEAAQLDALLSTITGEARTLIWGALIAAAKGYVETFKQVKIVRETRQHQKEGNTTDHT